MNDYNALHLSWTPRVSREKIKRLYISDSRGMLDEDLLDEIGYTIYLRCLEGKEKL